MAEDVAEDCAGVKQVHNRLRIEQAEGSGTSASSSRVIRDERLVRLDVRIDFGIDERNDVRLR